jgi:hypothetical protein
MRRDAVNTQEHRLTEEANSLLPVAHSPERAAELANLSRTRIFEAMRTGKLPAKKAGRRTLIVHDDLVRFVQSLPAARTAAKGAT